LRGKDLSISDIGCVIKGAGGLEAKVFFPERSY
jgi:hypothetical protein